MAYFSVTISATSPRYSHWMFGNGEAEIRQLAYLCMDPGKMAYVFCFGVGPYVKWRKSAFVHTL